ncbi:MAG TPA: rhodanese-like domain-containing protein [Candidatus Acidoferrales bacterium]|nr:rhodanese-like domain-containing protein [Candidatus Acidoferrales bacterium]
MAESQRVTAEELRSSAGSFRILDVRKNPDDRRIPGAERADQASLETTAAPPFARGESVVLYCNGGNSSSRIAKLYRDRGYDVRWLDGGLTAWLESGYPTEAGAR